MNILESISSAAYSVLANRMRSILTMLGIIIGIAAVIMITSIGQGFQDSINDMFADIGAGTIEVSVRHNLATPATTSDLLTMESVEFLSAHPDLHSVTPTVFTNGRVQLRNPTESSRVNVLGTTETFQDVQSLDIRFGRSLSEVDVERAAPVAIIDSRLARQVFGGRTDVVGESIRATFWFGTVDLLVVGVYRTDDMMAGFGDFEMPTTLVTPITYLQRIMNTENRVDNIFVNAATLDRLEQTAEEVYRLLSLKHGNEDRYNVTPIMNQLDMINDLINMVTGFVALVAFISLAVGGIGVMNIMLVTVTERTREIGIRKALGATDGNIQFQFLIEAMILTATGGIIGIMLGYYGGFALAGLIPGDIMPSVNIVTVTITVIASSLIGIIFGVYPARKADKLNPNETLRYK